jgi:hypothetical protein
VSTLRLNRTAIAVISFALRHFLIVIAAFFAGCLLWTLAYLGLLLVAVIGNHDLGGILAYPFGILAVALFCILFGWIIFSPACGLASLLCGWLRWPKFAAIPIVFITAFGIECLLCGSFARSIDQDIPGVWGMFKFHGLIVSLPLGAYWWMTEGPGALADALRRWLRKRIPRRNTSGIPDTSERSGPPHP